MAHKAGQGTLTPQHNNENKQMFLDHRQHDQSGRGQTKEQAGIWAESGNSKDTDIDALAYNSEGRKIKIKKQLKEKLPGLLD